MWKPEVF